MLPRDEFAAALAAVGRDGRAIYTPFRPEVLGEASSSDPAAVAKATKEDRWDGRGSREEAFIANVKKAAPSSEVKDLDPILDAMRAIKSPREIAVIREATRITGLAILEAMRDAKPGLYEYELQADAEFVFKKHGAYGPSYFALIATGTNTWYSHYHRNTTKLADGDLVQFDYAPDYKYYQSDVTRVFPANGRFTPRQRELYVIYLRLYQALMTSIKVHTAPRDIIKDAVVKMDAILAAYPFTDARIKAAATAFVERYRASRANSLGHWVGMEVHDVGGPAPTLEPGMIFTIEPAMQIPEEHLGIRLEDMILITDTRLRESVRIRARRAGRHRARDARARSVEEIAHVTPHAESFSAWRITNPKTVFLLAAHSHVAEHDELTRRGVEEMRLDAADHQELPALRKAHHFNAILHRLRRRAARQHGQHARIEAAVDPLDRIVDERRPWLHRRRNRRV